VLLPPGSQVNYGTPDRRRGSGLGFFIYPNARGLGRQDRGVCPIGRGLYGRPHGPRSGGCRVRVLRWRSMSTELAWRCPKSAADKLIRGRTELMVDSYALPPPRTAGTRSGHCCLLLSHDGYGSCDGTWMYNIPNYIKLHVLQLRYKLDVLQVERLTSYSQKH